MGKSKTRKIIFFIGFLFLTAKLSAQVNCTDTIPQSQNIIDGIEMSIQSGDVYCLEAGAKPYLLIRNIDPNDTFEEPVLFINVEGQLIIDTDHYFGITIQNSNNIHLSGKGVEGITYGINIRRVEYGSGIGISNKSSTAEIEGVEISNTSFAGIIAKTDPYCLDGEIMVTRDDFTQFDIVIHDNYIHDTGGEGMYIGSSKFTGFTLDCNGQTQTVLPHVNVGVQVYDNVVERTGWDAIQVSSVISDCNIHDNFVLHDSEEGYPGQMSGILIGGGSVCDCYNNQVFDGKGDGIEALGSGNQKIYNNLIVRAGQSFQPADPTQFKHAIYNDHIQTSSNAYLYFYNNTIISPKSFGITFRNDRLSNIRAYNNIIVDPGYTDGNGDPIYLNISDNSIVVDQQNNFLSPSVYDVNFDSPANDDYDLRINSPAVNGGVSLTDISFDILNRTRPYAGKWDIGAFETHKPGAGIDDPEHALKSWKIFPNPFNDELNMRIVLEKRVAVNYTIRNLLGNIVKQHQSSGKAFAHQFFMNTEQWPPGVYTYEVVFNHGRISGKIIKL